MDRYIRGEEVPVAELRPVWEDTTQTQIVSPRDGMIPELYRAVRAINMSLPVERRIRVLLGDPPIDWEVVRTPADHFRWMAMRDSHAAAVIQLEVLAKGRRALVVYGQGHAQRRQALSNYDMTDWRAQTIVSILEGITPTRVFTVWWAADLAVLQPDVASWSVPSLAVVSGTILGATDFAKFDATPGRFAVRNGRMSAVPRDQWREVPMEDQFNAVLYLGPPSAIKTAVAELSPAVCTDRSYLEVRLRRMAIGAPPPDAERLREYCAKLPAP